MLMTPLRARVGAATLAGAMALSMAPLQSRADETSTTDTIRPGVTTPRANQKTPGDKAGRSMATSSSEVVTDGFDELRSACPTGQVVGKTYSVESFENGIPYPDYSFEWGVTTPAGGPAPRGTWVARSDMEAGVDDVYWVNSTFEQVDTSKNLYLSFSFRGRYAAPADGPTDLAVWVNGANVTLLPTDTWTKVHLDVTSERATNEGFADVYFDLYGDGSNPEASWAEVDDVRLYTCQAAPNAGVRGDWTGEGKVDLVGTRTDGTMLVYPGLGNGKVSTGQVTGYGWNEYDWKGSPGDVTGDRRTDLIARKPDGTMWLFAGAGAGGLGAGKQIGSGWSAMTALATPTDMNRTGRPELLARRSDGTLHVYTFTSTGTLSYLKRVGTGWNNMVWIIGMGDLNNDGRGDTVGVHSNGCIYAYLTTSTLALGSARQQGCGWGSMNYLTSSGDMNGDRLGDLIARRADGTLWFYKGRSGGGVVNGVQVGSGWGSMASIL
ncbi:MAG TPA: VCBS repeat-containing protein [Intrasporangium sp.]|nr:VCBS repeat-containing protein [Intrasporangium sp.]